MLSLESWFSFPEGKRAKGRPLDDTLRKKSESYLDTIFDEGAGAKHSALLEKFASPSLRETLHGYHVMESNTEHVSIEENYLIGMCVLCASKNFTSAAMFAKTLCHLGVPSEKLFEAISRMSMWIGGVPAAEALGHIQKAVRHYERDGQASMAAWFPEEESK